MDRKELKTRKRELGYTNALIAELSGVPLSTVQKIFGGTTNSPRKETIEAIVNALFPESGTPDPDKDIDRALSAHGLNERLRLKDVQPLVRFEEDPWPVVMKEQGNYTVEDYNKLPEDLRAELIDGRLYLMAAPTTVHQYLAGAIHAQMTAYRKLKNRQCMPLVSPVDVQLDCDDKTIVQPDVVVLCDRTKLKRGIIYGAPELVVEVLSPSSRGKDRLVKLEKYWHAGVKEYWIIDPEHETVSVYHFASGQAPGCYSFDEQIPVGITDGDLMIDFREIAEDMRAFFGDIHESL